MSNTTSPPDLEEELDDVSAGQRDYKDVLARFWRDFSAAIAETTDLRIGEVLTKIDDFLAPHLYPMRADGSDPRVCPTCGKGRLNLKTARSGGAFIGCSNYPDCRYTRAISGTNDGEGGTVDGRVLGQDGGDDITLRVGRFGPYVQRGEATEANPKPPRASLPKGWAADAMDLDRALMLLNLPRLVGPHPADGEPVEAAIGRYGPYVKHLSIYANLPEVDEVFTIGMNRAVEVLAQKATRGRPASGAALTPLAVLGDHPDGGPVQVMAGRYGPYVKWGSVNATLPKGVEPTELALDEALVLIAERAAKGGKTKGRGTLCAEGQGRKETRGEEGGEAKGEGCGGLANRQSIQHNLERLMVRRGLRAARYCQRRMIERRRYDLCQRVQNRSVQTGRGGQSGPQRRRSGRSVYLGHHVRPQNRRSVAQQQLSPPGHRHRREPCVTPLPKRIRPFRNFPQPLGQRLRLGTDDRPEQIGLVREVVIQRAARHPSCRRDLGRAGFRIALGQKQPVCSPDQTRAHCLTALVLRSAFAT